MKLLPVLRFVVILSGLIGNIVIFIIFSRRAFEKNSISIYCRALAVFESLTIVHLVYEAGNGFFGYFLGNYSDIACSVYNYANTAFGSIPGWILIGLSIDKVLSMKNIGNSLIKKRWFQLIVIASIVIFNLLLYIEIPIYQRLSSYKIGNTTNNICILSMLPFGDVINWIYLIEGNILPFLIMFTTSIISIRLIRKSSKNISAQLASSERRRKRDIKFAVSSITFNFMFIILRLPVVILAILSSFISLSDLALSVTYLFYFVNFSSGIIVHLVSNNIFRREFLVFFRCQKPSNGSQSNSRNKRA